MNGFKENIIYLIGILFLGGVLMGCESEVDSLGSHFLEGDRANLSQNQYDVIAYNISNSDTIRADGRISSSLRKDTIVLGGFSENHFGQQFVSFVTQVQLSSYAPDFGTSPEIDSVVLELKPRFEAKSATTTTDENFIWQENNTPAKKQVTTYNAYKYGKNAPILKINIHEVTEFLGSTSDIFYSNKAVSLGQLIGEKDFIGSVSAVKITSDSDNSTLLEREPTIRIPLNKDFFKQKIIEKQGQAVLENMANFIRYFNGIRISVLPTDGYMFKVALPTANAIRIYYKNSVTNNGQTTQTPAQYTLNLNNTNTSFTQVDYNRVGTSVASALSNIDENLGDAQLYVQGMGGSNFVTKIPESVVTELRTKFQNDKIGIISAKFRFHIDENLWNNSYQRPVSLTIMKDLKDTSGKTLYQFLEDMSVFASQSNYRLVRGYDLNQITSYYDVDITQTLKNIIEKNQTNDKFILKLGQYLINSSTGVYLGQNIDNRIYSPERMILVGSKNSSTKKPKLLIDFAQK